MLQNNQNSSSPLVSVIVPTYNRPVYLYQALSSILRQSYVNLQIIVVNDGGEDVSGLIQSFKMTGSNLSTEKKIAARHFA